MSQLIDMIEKSTPAERASALVYLVRDVIRKHGDMPVAIQDESTETIAYLSTKVRAAGTLP